MAVVPCFVQVCPTQFEWVEPFLPKLREVDVARLSGSTALQQQGAAGGGAAGEKAKGNAAGSDGAKLARRVGEDNVAAARARYLARKQQQPKKK